MSKKNISAGDVDTTVSFVATPPEKALRADAKKNRDKLLDVAHRVFTTEGIAVSMDEIARRAGVGVGTVYRHFPTKEDLFGAVIVSHKARLMEEANQLLYHDNPGEAFFHYFATIIREGIANKAITDALVSSLNIEAGRSEVARDFWQGIDNLLARAKQSGSVRADARLEDIKMLLSGILQAAGDGGSFPDRVVSILCDGLRG
ncbi:transcriptional regulator, TetR family [Paenibacillus algorifonticola]|uniref:Transcriptional regulator, TetR family n=1 Tax=Paenibacillus algorifonticola TaxID=684063 RepID=A0A1I2FK60_9BACL|nr:TetR/AcrR family transcriptional regulator [Paenibacillus algorifonticola]SFF04841.1 transcriptional regulator, TetR family [Paenibacillus algorifonticola]